MRKTFQLRPEGKHPDRVLDATKHEIRKYLKRERRRELPQGVDYWDFDCKFGLTAESAQAVHLANVITCIDSAAKDNAQQVYVEIWATHGVRTKRPVAQEHETPAPEGADATDHAPDNHSPN